MTSKRRLEAIIDRRTRASHDGGAGSGHSLIAVSDSGKSRLKRFLVGSVAFNVMGRAQNSVLNVR